MAQGQAAHKTPDKYTFDLEKVPNRKNGQGAMQERYQGKLK